MPLPSQPIRSQSVPADLSSPSQSGWHPSWAPYRVRLNQSKSLVSFNLKAKTFDIIPYPCYDNGKLVPPDELIEYWETRDFELPYCFCVLVTGVASQTVFIIPTYIKSPALGKVSLTCKDRKCPYFRVMEELLEINPEPVSGIYPLLESRRTAVTPPFVWNRHGTPTSTPPRGGMATRLLTGGPTTPTGKPTASGSNRLLTPSPLRLSMPKNKAGDPLDDDVFDDKANVFDDKATSSGSQAEPFLGENAIFTQATPTRKKRASPEDDVAPDADDIKQLTASGADPSLVTELLKTYTVGIALLDAIKPFEPQDANMTLARTHDPSQDGITLQELIRSLGRCNACDRVMAYHLVGIHDCRASPANGGPSKPTKKMKLVGSLTPKPKAKGQTPKAKVEQKPNIKTKEENVGSVQGTVDKGKGKRKEVRTRALNENGQEVIEILSD
ncbi:hypothetical protein FA95DRAFT_1642508 [Auriscalpium vulgare]|uniref:Uncharacterized protein n=1 Tax=Auriscalpium vulgare TaxID=40419 RepID=A0ACB8RAT6_9AGAM|nr:hypothetical protein FA95DRAFT_1642508 [Auriscalpium vulgare]